MIARSNVSFESRRARAEPTGMKARIGSIAAKEMARPCHVMMPAKASVGSWSSVIATKNIDTVEMKAESVEDVRAARGWASRNFEVYCEAPLGPEMERVLDAIARAGLHAKIRTGGTTPEAIPSFERVAAFLCGCVARGVVAKATAGLHHVVTGDHVLGTRGSDATARMLGFLNIVLGAGIAEGAGRAAAQSADICTTVAHLLAVAEVPTWIGHAQVAWGDGRGPIIEGPLEQFAVSGRAIIRSIGTCSFEEPVDDARRIGLIA